MQPQQLAQVYGAAAWTYVQRGWLGVLPLPPGAKTEPPTGYTGETGRYPTQEDVQRWVVTHSGGNIALRLSDTTLGLDVDAYEGKLGGQTLAGLEAQLGQLPPTWVSTSREDGSGSGIRIFRVPGGLTWRNDIGADIDVIRRSWRYAVVWPSTHPKTRATYRWYAPGWIPAVTPPSAADLAILPFPWVQFLTEVPAPKKKAVIDPFKSDDFFAPGLGIELVNRRIRMRLDSVTDHARRGWAGFRDTLRDSSFEIGGYVGGGHLTYDDAQLALTQAIVNASVPERPTWPNEDDLLWIQQGLDDGSAQPIKVEKPRPVSRPKDRPGGTEAEAEVKDTEGGRSRKLPLIPDKVWERRGWLRAIRDRSRGTSDSPDGVLGAALGIYAASVPHNIKISTGIRRPIGFSLLVGLVSKSGRGKSSAWGMACDEFAPADAAPIYPVPTGEGITEKLMGWEKKMVANEAGEIKEVKVKVQVRHNAIFHIDEGAALNAGMLRDGASVGAVMRAMFSDQQLGNANADSERERNIPRGQYTISLIVGYQPSTAMRIVRDTSTGMAQRFLWFSARRQPTTEPGIPEVPSFVLPRVTSLPTATLPGGKAQHLVHVEPAVAALIQRESDERDAADEDDAEDDLDSQRPVVVAKLAGLACLIEGRTQITMDDWLLGCELYAASCAVRDELIELDEERTAVERRTQAAQMGEADQIRKTYGVEVVNVAGTIVRRLQKLGRSVPHRDLVHAVASKHRVYLRKSIELAVERSWIVEVEGKFMIGDVPFE
jgi:hypothetical protein